MGKYYFRKAIFRLPLEGKLQCVKKLDTLAEWQESLQDEEANLQSRARTWTYVTADCKRC